MRLTLACLILLSFFICSYCEGAFSNNIFDVIHRPDLAKVKAILEKHPEYVNKVSYNGNSPLHIAAELGQTEIAKLLILKGADINLVNNKKMTPLHYAAQGHYEKERIGSQSDIAKLLISKGASINAVDQYGNTPLIYASLYANYKIVACLISQGADINKKVIVETYLFIMHH